MADRPPRRRGKAREQSSEPPAVHLRSACYGAFLYRKMVARVAASVRDGDLVPVIDKRGETFGWGFYNSQSKIALRMVSFGAEKPAQTYLADRIHAAVRLRRDVLKLDGATDAYRVIHAEGDALSGLIADRFGSCIVLELFSKAMFLRLEEIRRALGEALPAEVQNVVMRADDDVQRQENFRMGKLADAPRRTVTVTENGVRFEVDLTKGHKTGFFCDQRDNRLALTELTAGADMLDMCCYTGGFSCHAAGRGGAKSVTAVDIDEPALDVARRNVKLNRLSEKVEVKQSDAFDFFRYALRDGRSWDVVVLDPPKFVPDRDEMARGMRKYADLNFLAAGVVRPGGLLLTCSCSGLVDREAFLHTIGRSVRKAGRRAQILRMTGAGADHPVMTDALEGEYLKAAWLRLD